MRNWRKGRKAQQSKEKIRQGRRGSTPIREKSQVYPRGSAHSDISFKSKINPKNRRKKALRPVTGAKRKKKTTEDTGMNGSNREKTKRNMGKRVCRHC